MASLQGKTALVTGGNRGIGRGIAIHLASQGANLVLADISQDGLDEVAGVISQSKYRSGIILFGAK